MGDFHVLSASLFSNFSPPSPQNKQKLLYLKFSGLHSTLKKHNAFISHNLCNANICLNQIVMLSALLSFTVVSYSTNSDTL